MLTNLLLFGFVILHLPLREFGQITNTTLRLLHDVCVSNVFLSYRFFQRFIFRFQSFDRALISGHLNERRKKKRIDSHHVYSVLFNVRL